MSNGSAAIAHGVLMRLHRLRRGLRNKGTPMIKTVAALLAAGIVFTAPAQAEEISQWNRKPLRRCFLVIMRLGLLAGTS
jgi:hypothetical protein